MAAFSSQPHTCVEAPLHHRSDSAVGHHVGVHKAETLGPVLVWNTLRIREQAEAACLIRNVLGIPAAKLAPVRVALQLNRGF
jgi:hypothetical protein